MEASLSKALWFTLRTDKVLKDGKAPINMFYTLNNVRLRYNTDQKIFPEYWNKKDREVVYLNRDDAKRLLPNLTPKEYLTKIEVDSINEKLSALSSKVKSIENTFIALKKPFSAKTVIDELKKQEKEITGALVKIEEPTNLLFDFMDRYIAEHESTREAGSLTVYKSVKNHLKAYQDTTGHKVSFEGIDYNFFNKLQSFLIRRTKTDKQGNTSPMLNNTTIAKALSTLKTFLSYARRQGIKVNEGYRDFVIKKQNLEVIALDQQEFDAILNLDLSNDRRLDRARDLFCFSCASGLRYSDVSQLRREHISDDTITLTVKKTKTELTIPLNSITAAILDKYKDLHKPLSMVSNQGLNKSIKDLCKIAGIDKPIEVVRYSGVKKLVTVYPKYELCHFHTARKTFCTLSLEKGMSAEQVMGISGHTDYKSFKRYVDVTEKLKKVVMLKAWGAPVTKLKVV